MFSFGHRGRGHPCRSATMRLIGRTKPVSWLTCGTTATTTTKRKREIKWLRDTFAKGSLLPANPSVSLEALGAAFVKRGQSIKQGHFDPSRNLLRIPQQNIWNCCQLVRAGSFRQSDKGLSYSTKSKLYTRNYSKQKQNKKILEQQYLQCGGEGVSTRSHAAPGFLGF